MHFTHLNINSVLPKIDELRLIASETNCAVISISETKLDETVQDEEISVQGYNLIQKDRCRNGGGVACYIKNDIHLEKNLQMRWKVYFLIYFYQSQNQF